MTDLDSRLIAAHDAGDRAGLVALYQQAAAQARDPDAAAFFLVQAYVFALDSGDPAAAALHAQLAGLGREDPDSQPPASLRIR